MKTFKDNFKYVVEYDDEVEGEEEEEYDPNWRDTPDQTEGKKRIANFREYYQIKDADRLITSKDEKISFRDSPPQVEGRKPKGLWYSCGSEWIDWLETEMPQWTGKHFFSLEIHEDKMLMINTDEKFELFQKEYGVAGEFDRRSIEGIDWSRVGAEYSGIEICPRMGDTSGWYYGWDVASGCVWKRDAVKDVKRIM